MNVSKSKFISKILRHDPTSYNLVMDENGWVGVFELMKVVNCTINDIFQIVELNDKKRFEFNESKSKIRAVQGHSINVAVDLHVVTDKPKQLYHGTKLANIESIKANGLVKMNRLHVHLTLNYQLAQKRAGKNGVVLLIDSSKINTIYLSNNGVYLVDYVAPELITY